MNLTAGQCRGISRILTRDGPGTERDARVVQVTSAPIPRDDRSMVNLIPGTPAHELVMVRDGAVVWAIDPNGVASVIDDQRPRERQEEEEQDEERPFRWMTTPQMGTTIPDLPDPPDAIRRVYEDYVEQAQQQEVAPGHEED